MNQSLSNSQQRSLKRSFSELFTYFSTKTQATDQQMACLYKWGRQLGITPTELKELQSGKSSYAYEYTKTDALAFAYDLVCLIYMDEVVEDVELKMASSFADEVLGLKPHIINNLLKAIITAQLDGIPNEDIRGDIQEHPEVYF